MAYFVITKCPHDFRVNDMLQPKHAAECALEKHTETYANELGITACIPTKVIKGEKNISLHAISMLTYGPVAIVS